MAEIKQKIITRKTPDLLNISVDGAFGGMLPNGKININFYTDSLPIPAETIIKYDTETKKIETKHSEDLTESVERQIVSSISFELTKAKEIHYWLGQIISEAILNRKEAENASNI